MKTPFLFAADADDAGGRGEVGEVPDVLANDSVNAVEDSMVHIQIFDLVILAPRASGNNRMQTRIGVGAILGDDDRLAFPGPSGQLLLPGQLGRLQVAGVDVPAAVAFSINTSPNLDNRHLPCGASMTLTKPTGRVGSASGYVEERPEVVLRLRRF